ncbi:MAG: hypothetical protein COA97_04690 [Flavobacteriales bacterium]|nr:MAG: hypothetical protein COA97_04690 [Flavobacteriales bacterium]
MRLDGNKIKEARKLNGLTQEALADLAKMNLRTIQRIENSESVPNGSSLNLICDALNININDVVVKEKNKKEIGSFIINGFFLIILNFVIITIFGFLIVNHEATYVSRIGGLLLGFFIPVFIVLRTQKMTRVERMLKFGFGFIIYVIISSFKVKFPVLIMSGELPTLLIFLGTLYYGKAFFNK